MSYRIRSIYTASILILLIFILSGIVSAGPSTISIPYIDKITIDGQSADWGNDGYYVGMMGLTDNRSYSSKNLQPSFRLAWNNDGLMLFVKIIDNKLIENDGIGTLYLGDCVEVWVASKAPENYQIAITPGADGKHNEMRTYFWDWRKNKEKFDELKADVKTAKIPGGYAIEALFPWSNLGVTPKKGLEAGFQIVVDDIDRPDQTYDEALHAFWTPQGSKSNFYTIKLDKEATSPMLINAKSSYDRYRYITFDVNTAPDLIGKELVVKNGRRKLASGKVVQGNDGWGNLKVSIPINGISDSTPGVFNLYSDGVNLGSTELKDAPGFYKVKTLSDANLRFMPYVFGGNEFPGCDFQQPLLAEELIGPYSIKTTFYDANYNLVTTAQKPGRYGAIIEVTPKNGGKTIRRFRTLFKQPEQFEWWNVKFDASVNFPKELGIDPAVVSEQSDLVADMIKWNMVESFDRNPYGAVVLAGLYEAKPSGAKQSIYSDVNAKDRQWWVGLKRKFYGTDKLYPNVITAPKQIEGSPAPVIHEGSLQEAGMKPDTVENLDKLLNEWSSNSEEAFAVLIARHGTIVLHKAYGMRNGKPMTVDTKSWMASNTKTLSANLLWMLVDQGLVDVDATVDTYLPAFKDIKVKKPMTVRNLYTHTWGFDSGDHWGDDMSDLEEVISEYYPYLKVADFQVYNGVGYAIGGKIIETISGESIPAFYKKHLLDPLGCVNTDVVGTMGDAGSVPMDMGKVAQLMLNKGAYGNMRFYSEDTFNKMLPDKLSKILNKSDASTMFADGMWGVGLMSYESEGLGKGTFGHGAASGATLRIDPVNDMIIVMTRDNVGKDSGVYSKYHDLFIKAVIAGIDNER